MKKILDKIYDYQIYSAMIFVTVLNILLDKKLSPFFDHGLIVLLAIIGLAVLVRKIVKTKKSLMPIPNTTLGNKLVRLLKVDQILMAITYLFILTIYFFQFPVDQQSIYLTLVFFLSFGLFLGLHIALHRMAIKTEFHK